MRHGQQEINWKNGIAMLFGAILGTAAAVIVLALIVNALLNLYLRSVEAVARPQGNVPGHVAPAPEGPPGQ
ncbi:MAG: hypothetical protein RL272_228 [Candidatus Parcubacteria bacterium]